MKRKPTPAQIAARKRFAEMARSGAFKKKAAKARKKNPRASNPIKKFIVYTETKPGNWKQVRVTENLDIAKDLAKSNAESGYPSIVEDATGAIVYTPKVASNPVATKRKANPVKLKVPKYTVQTLTSGKANWKRVAMFDSLEQAKAYAEAVPRAYKVVAVRVIDDK